MTFGLLMLHKYVCETAPVSMEIRNNQTTEWKKKIIMVPLFNFPLCSYKPEIFGICALSKRTSLEWPLTQWTNTFLL